MEKEKGHLMLMPLFACKFMVLKAKFKCKGNYSCIQKSGVRIQNRISICLEKFADFILNPGFYILNT